MIVVGRLEGALDGRPLAIDAEGGTITVRPSGLRGAWALRRHRGAARPLVEAAARRGVRVRVKLPGLPAVPA